MLEGYWPRDNVLHCCVGTSVGGVLAARQGGRRPPVRHDEGRPALVQQRA